MLHLYEYAITGAYVTGSKKTPIEPSIYLYWSVCHFATAVWWIIEDHCVSTSSYARTKWSAFQTKMSIIYVEDNKKRLGSFSNAIVNISANCHCSSIPGNGNEHISTIVDLFFYIDNSYTL